MNGGRTNDGRPALPPAADGATGTTGAAVARSVLENCRGPRAAAPAGKDAAAVRAVRPVTAICPL